MPLRLNRERLAESVIGAEAGVMDGRPLKAAMLDQLTEATRRLHEACGVTPRLAVVQVGEDPASSIYVRNKMRSCKQVGILSDLHHLPDDTSTEVLHRLLDTLNADAQVHGILIQLPLPAHLDPHDAIQRVEPHKDVDGYHPVNLGYLMAWRGTLEPCTPRGIMTLLAAYDVNLSGVDALVIGRSMTVGRPMAQMLMRANATVTVCHRHTADLAQKVASADLVVVATGVAELVKGAWIKPGAVVIDVGISRREDGSLSGDVEYEAARERASLITPVPGGVGQLTVATLLENTVRAACAANAFSTHL